jgi:hypothetical protein
MDHMKLSDELRNQLLEDIDTVIDETISELLFQDTEEE